MSNLAAPPESALILLQSADDRAHPGIIDGYRKLQAAGEVTQVDIMPVLGPDGVARGSAFWEDAFERAFDHGATLVVFQYYHRADLPDPREAIRKFKSMPNAPFVVSAMGDPFMSGYFGRPNVPRTFLMAAESSDLVVSTSMGVMADHLRRHTRAPVALLPNGTCQVRFGRALGADSSGQPEFDVVFIGSRNSSRNLLRSHAWYARERDSLVDALTRRFGSRFAVFGNGWDHKSANQGPVPHSLQAQVARRGRVVVGGIPYSRARYYTSGRPFFQATSGVPIVDSLVPGVGTILRPDEHWILAPQEDLVRAVERTLELGDTERQRIGAAAAEYVLSAHTQAHRVATLLENVRRLRRIHETGVPEAPYLPFFLPEVDVAVETRRATRGWPGIS